MPSLRLARLLAIAALGVAHSLSAQTAAPRVHRTADRLKFVLGAALAFGGHESGHVVSDLAFGAHPYLDKVHFGPIPFFAVAQRNPVTPRQEFIISSAGFWVQGITNEWILTAHPQLREEHHPLMKGMFAFNILLSLGYGVGALFEVGPTERDPRSMAAASRVAEPLIGVMVLAPALLDAYRYSHPGKRWPAWASRLVKLGSVALTLRSATH